MSNLETQVQVQTVYGVSRSATVAFPTCAAACQNDGTCWWSKDAIALECVCTSYLYYGAQCQNSASFPTTNRLPPELTFNLPSPLSFARIPGRRADPAGGIAHWRRLHQGDRDRGVRPCLP